MESDRLRKFFAVLGVIVFFVFLIGTLAFCLVPELGWAKFLIGCLMVSIGIGIVCWGVWGLIELE